MRQLTDAFVAHASARSNARFAQVQARMAQAGLSAPAMDGDELPAAALAALGAGGRSGVWFREGFLCMRLPPDLPR